MCEIYPDTASNGYKGELKDHIRFNYVDSKQCNRYNIKDCGPPQFAKL